MPLSLFNSYTIGSLELKNRFVRSATWDGTADASGMATDASVSLYRSLGQGGIGLIITGLAFISANGQGTYGQYGIYSDKMIPGLRRMVQAAHQEGTKIAAQIVHAGIHHYPKDAAAPAVSIVHGVDRPHYEMTEEQIETTITDFVSATVRAREAGFDCVQLHGAHSYLMSQFLSPLFNLRADRWGGSAGNRMRFHLEVIRRIRRVVGTDYPLIIKLGIQDDKEGGLSRTEGIAAAQQIAKMGIDAIEVSTGIGTSVRTLKLNNPDRGQAYFRDRAAAVKRAVTVPVIAVGGIRSLEMARDIIESGDADLIAMSRPFIREPDLLLRWLRDDQEHAQCISCGKCLADLQKDTSLKCSDLQKMK